MKRIVTILTILGLVLLVAAACSGGGAQTEPTIESAGTPDTAQASPTSEVEATEPPATATEEPATETPVPEPTETATEEPPTETPTETPTPTAEPVEPSVTVSDQEIVDGTVTIDEAALADGGWMVIHLDVDGNPGPVIGFAPLEPGVNENVVVDIDVAQATPSLIAMLHVDDGNIGDYEFPDADPPVLMDGEMVIQSFAVSGLEAATEEAIPVDQVEVTIQGFSFNPEEVTIPIGTTVVWTNMGSGNHTVTADNGAFASDTLSSGDSFSFTFNTPGTYAYYCEFHGGPGGEGMSAVITVTE
jgi:plastocyanin